jgi:branched-chain amino acid transport system substrate-binding protein
VVDNETPESAALLEIDRVNALTGGDAVPVGIITPLSGPGDATAGTLVVRGACLGAQYVAETGGMPGGRGVRLVLQNDQASAKTEGMQRSAVGGVAKLAVVDKCLAALGQWHLRTTPWVAETAEGLGMPIFIENGHNTVTAKKYRTVFRTYSSIADRVPLMVDFLRAQGVRRLGILAADTVFGLMTADTVEGYCRPRGVEVLRFDFEQETTAEVREPLKRIGEFRPDAILSAAVVRTNYMVIEQAAEIGLRPAIPMMVSFGFPMRSADFWRLAGEAGNGIIWPSTPYRPSWSGLTEIGRWFTNAYVERYGSFPPDTALSAFTDVTLIARALDQAREHTREALIESLEANEFETWRGPIRFERGEEHWHHSSPEVLLMQYQTVGQSFDEAVVVAPEDAATGPYRRPDELA